MGRKKRPGQRCNRHPGSKPRRQIGAVSIETRRYPKRIANAKQAAPSRATKLVLDAFSKAKLTFDPSNKTDAQWLMVLQARYDLHELPATASVAPRLRIQDKNSRLATEHLLSKLREIRSAVLLCEQEAERVDIPAMKQNVALRVREELYQLQTIWKTKRVSGHDHAQWIGDFVGMIDDLEWSAAQALEVGIHAPHGKSNLLVSYTTFVRGLYELWRAKTSLIGVYKSGGHYTGPFVELVERCEELLSPDVKPPSANARGKRVARAIGVHKKPKPS
jgi:hypothetical protein